MHARSAYATPPWSATLPPQIPGRSSLAYDHVRQLLKGGKTVILDGAMGTEIQARGSNLLRVAWGGPASIESPDMVRGIHADYISAGADVITTNTFRGSRPRLRANGLEAELASLNQRSVALAIEALSRAGAAVDRVAIAGAISTASVRELEEPHEGYDAYVEQAKLLADAGADLILLEMLKDIHQTQAALAAAAETGLPVWAGFSCRTDEEGVLRVLEGNREGALAPTFHEALSAIGELQVDAALIMHTTVEDVTPALAVLGTHWNGPTGAYPHVGNFTRPNWEFNQAILPALITGAASQWQAQGAQIFGTCCGLGPDYISALNTMLR
jgi:homocysteine S-methyltransferase